MLKQFLAYFQGTSKMGGGTTGHNALCAHSLTFAGYTRASALDSISSPPCSNLCIPFTRPSLLSSDRRRACKKIACKPIAYRHQLPRHKRFPVFAEDRWELLWDALDAHQCEACRHGRCLLNLWNVWRKDGWEWQMRSECKGGTYKIVKLGRENR